MTGRREALMLGTAALVGAVSQATYAQPVQPTLFQVEASDTDDAELIRVCAEFSACHRQHHAIWDGPSTSDEAATRVQPVLDRMRTLLDQMEALRASTARGIQARAGSLAQIAGDGASSFDAEGTFPHRMLWCLLRDAAAIEAGRVATHPDADLIATCAAFDNLERAYIATDHGAEDGSLEDVAAKAEQDRLTTAQDPLIDRMVELRAITREGMAARARSLILWDPELMKADGDMAAYTGGRLTQALVRDLLAGSAAA